MRVAIDIRHLTHPQLSGVGLYTVNLIRSLARIAPAVEFILFASGSKKTLARLPIITAPNITIIKKQIPNRLLFALLRLPGGPTLESFLPHPVDCWLFPDANIIRTNLPYALTVHDLSHDILPQFFTLKDRLRNRIANVNQLTNKANIILAVSHNTKQDLVNRWHINQDKIIVTHLGVGSQFTPHVAPSDTNYQRGYGLNGPYILSLGTQEPRKNVESIIAAFNNFRASSPTRLQLAIGGAKGWKYHSILDAAKASPYSADIVFLGYIHEKHKPALYRGAQAFLFPSFYEGFGLPVLEAMACSTPVITSFTSSLPELVGDAGLLTDPFNITDLTTALSQLLTSPSLQQTFRAQGPLRARLFTWDKTATLTMEALYSLK